MVLKLSDNALKVLERRYLMKDVKNFCSSLKRSCFRFRISRSVFFVSVMVFV